MRWTGRRVLCCQYRKRIYSFIFPYQFEQRSMLLAVVETALSSWSVLDGSVRCLCEFPFASWLIDGSQAVSGEEN